MTQSTPYRLSPKIQLEIRRSLERRHSLRPITIKWVNIQGQVCKRIIKQNMCFCNHSYACHQYHFTMQPYCKVKNCQCKCFEFIPHFDIKCLCKHSSKDHYKQSKRCRFCTKCTGFLSSWACKCGFKLHQHKTEIYQEWDKQLKILPKVQKKYFINSNNNSQLSNKHRKSQPYYDSIDQIEQNYQGYTNKPKIKKDQQYQQQKKQLSQSQQIRSKRLKQANQRVLKIYQNQINSLQKQKYVSKQHSLQIKKNYSDVISKSINVNKSAIESDCCLGGNKKKLELNAMNCKENQYRTLQVRENVSISTPKVVKSPKNMNKFVHLSNFILNPLEDRLNNYS